MFILSESAIGLPLSNINKIIITYFSSKSDIINIYDTNFQLNENIIPLITSVLEIQPKITNYKQYNCINNTIIIKEHSKCILHSAFPSFPSFFYDIDALANPKGQSHITIKEQHIVKTIIDDNDNQIIRIYNDISIPGQQLLQHILNETEYKKISWEFDWGCFEIIININNKNNNKHKISELISENAFIEPMQYENQYEKQYENQYKVNYQVHINIIEDNKIIESRLIKINDILNKINKIKYIFI
jgi:hypothetical protein